MSNAPNYAMTLITEADFTAIARLDDLVTASQTALVEAESKPMLKGILYARAMNQIRDGLSGPVLADIKRLAGTPLGFKTDRDSGDRRYSDEVIRDVAAVALLDGARIVGNEFNIIAGNYYRTKEQLERRVREWPGLTRLRIELGLPAFSQGNDWAFVSAWASWKLDGIANSIECKFDDAKRDTRIAVKVNAGMGIDGIHGKAKRKLYHRIWEILKGCSIDDFDEDEQDDERTITVAATVVESESAETKVESESAETKPAQAETKAPQAEKPDPKPETKPEPKADPKDAVWREYMELISGADQITEVGKIRDHYFGPDSKHNWNHIEQQRGEDIAEMRRVAIRDSRGSKKR